MWANSSLSQGETARHSMVVDFDYQRGFAMKKKKIAVIGGDRRQVVLAQYLQKNGADVYTYGLLVKPDSAITVCDDLRCALREAAAVVLPLPAFTPELTLKTDGERKITLTEICDTLDEGTVLLGGMLRETVREELSKREISFLDYYEGEDLQRLNAITTAEGALEVAISHSERTIAGSRALVIGYGRIGKVLARYLAALGARVTVAARRETHFEMIRMSGFTPVATGALLGSAAEADLIFNTVPAPVLGEEELRRIRKNTLIVELASAPYGVDLKAAEELGKRALLAASLPGKLFPCTAGETIGIIILELLRKRGVL